MSEKDIFDLDNLESVVRTLVKDEAEHDRIKLSDFDQRTYSIPQDYKTIQIKLRSSEPKHVRGAIERICERFESEGYSPNIYTAVYEAVLNAFQHGHNHDPSKNINLGYKMSNSGLDIMIEDEGGLVEPDFISFILRHREGAYKKKFLNYYEFSGKPQPDGNCGTGTSFMHTYVDNVNYYISEKGGLIVHLRKDKNK